MLRSVRDKVAVIPIGAHAPDPVDAALVQRLRQRYGERRIVFSLGRMTNYKGWEVLIEAALGLPADALVLIGGGGPELPRYRARAAAAGVEDRLHSSGR